MSDTDETSSAKRVEAHDALFDAALKAARYLEDAFTPWENQSQGAYELDAGKQYSILNVERANIALKLLDIAYSSDK
jgi:hypothetical protein